MRVGLLVRCLAAGCLCKIKTLVCGCVPISDSVRCARDHCVALVGCLRCVVRRGGGAIYVMFVGSAVLLMGVGSFARELAGGGGGAWAICFWAPWFEAYVFQGRVVFDWCASCTRYMVWLSWCGDLFAVEALFLGWALFFFWFFQGGGWLWCFFVSRCAASGRGGRQNN